MALGGIFEFLEPYFDGNIDIVEKHILRRFVNIGYRKPFGRFEHPLTSVKRRLEEPSCFGCTVPAETFVTAREIINC